jgi:hypothetical protein
MSESKKSEEIYDGYSLEELQKLPITSLEKYEEDLKMVIEYLEYLYSVLPDESYQENKESSIEILQILQKIIQEKYDNDDYEGCSLLPLE